MHEIKLPQLGQSVEEASIVQWLKKEGDPVSVGDILFSIQTDKAEIECECTANGVLRKILVGPDVEVPVRTVVALVGEPGEALPDLSAYAGGNAPAASAEAEKPAPTAEATFPQAAQAAAASDGRIAASPRAKKLAAEQGIDLSTLAGSGAQGRIMEADVASASPTASAKITPTAKRLAEISGVDVRTVAGTGPGGKIMKDDVAAAKTAPAAPVAASAPAEAGEGVKRTRLTPMRRIIAERMVESLFTAPHYYMSMEIDMTAAAAFRKKSPFRPSFNAIVLYAVSRALRQHPQVNARWAGDAIDEVADVAIGVAVALPAGLVVPVLRKAQNLSLEGIQEESKALAEKARTGKLLPDDYAGSTFTVSNLGSFGVDQFTAIINQPNSAILSVGAIKDKPVVIDGGIHIRSMMNLTLSSDHRVIDGAVAAQFLATMREILESGQF